MKKKMNNKGFSLVELIVVIAIMAVLAVTLAPRLTQYIEKSRVASDTEVVNSIFMAAKLANAEFPLTSSSTVSIDLNGTAYTAFTAGTERNAWDLKTSYTYATNQNFMNAFMEALSDFDLKSNDVSDTTTITVQVDTNGYVAVGLDYVPAASDTSIYGTGGVEDDIIVAE